MNMKSKMAVLITAGLLASSVASIAQAAVELDPNLASSTVGEEVDVAQTGPELAFAPDPNLAPTTVFQEPRPGEMEQAGPEISFALDSNLVVTTVH